MRSSFGDIGDLHPPANLIFISDALNTNHGTRHGYFHPDHQIWMDLSSQPRPANGPGNVLLSAYSFESHNHGLQGEVEVPHHDPSFEKLLRGLQFSRRFVASYNAVLVLLLLLVASLHFIQNSRRERRQKALVTTVREETHEIPSKHVGVERYEARDDVVPSSGSSSIITGTATPPDLKDVDDTPNEHTSLLSRPDRRERKWANTKTSLRAFLMYQPGPIPIVNRNLPHNATTLTIFAFYGLNIFYLLFKIPFDGVAIPILADRFGLLFATNLPLLYLLAAKNQPVKQLTGHSYEALNILHRRVGELMCFFASLHMVGIFTIWYILLRPALHVSLYHFILEPVVLFGLCCFISYQLLYISSLGSFRKWWYELFLASHVSLQLAAAVFLWFHYPTSRIYVSVALLLFCVDRVVYRLMLKSHTAEATVTVMEDGETVLLSANWAIQTQKSTSLIAGWKPTDHVFLSVPVFGFQDNLQSHPFTIASAAPNLSVPQPHAWLSLLVRAQDGFSRRILDYACQQSMLNVRLDGPYGSSHPLDALRDSDLAIVVAGGSGIAVAFPLIWALLEPRQDGQDSESKWSRRTVCLVWVVHSREHLSWLPQTRLDELKEWGLELCIPPPTVSAGRPDIAEIVQDLVYQHQASVRSAVVVSGPDGMNRAVRNACSVLVHEGMDVTVQVEKFGW
jgi:NAD(P)H-flavin reductase